MIYKSTREEVQAYFQSSALNQSELKLLANYSLTHYNAEKAKQADPDKLLPDHFRQGGAVDTLLTGTKEEFDALYHIADTSKLPSDTIKKIVDFAFQNFVADLQQTMEAQGVTENIEEVLNLSPLSDEDIFPHVIMGCNREEYFLNRKDDSRFNTCMNTGKGREYFESLVEAFGKTILPMDMYKNIKEIVSSFKNSERTKFYFDEKNFENNPNLDIYYQKIIYFTYQGIACKAMLDILIVDKTNPDRVVFHPIDIKTMAEPAIDFPVAAKRLRYDIQAGWYKIALLHCNIAKQLTAAKRQFALNNFRFLAETTSQSYRNKALCFTMENSMVIIGINGKEEVRGPKGELYKPGILGITQLLEIYKYHSEKKNFKDEKLLEEYPSEIPFNWEYSKLTSWF